jgi:UDP-N-acetylmuramate: L-alanyl-gamma-D-glutamyl-meso-diaminopimelate ligase
MPKDYFKVNETTSLHTIPKGSKIHVIGVCGVAMAQLSVSLTERGYVVSGSDKEYYEPMRSLLASSPVQTKTGYNAENVPLDAALVVIGNAISYGNPEVDVVEQHKLPYTCFPKILQEVAISGKHSIVVTGTHGKSTTTALIASLLLGHGKEPSYFVGGIAKGLPQSLAVGKGGFSVVEGDEYDSAFFAKVPKFSFYTPDTAVVNAIEYDHADIYPNVEAIENEFSNLVASVPASGRAICCIDFPRVKNLVAKWRAASKCKVITFGKDPESDYRIVARDAVDMSQKVTVEGPGLPRTTFFIPMVGEYNARNALAGLIVSECVGLDRSKTLELLGTFERVKRRQEVRAKKGGIVLIEDFAHHPTAAQQTVDAVREAFPAAKIWAVFEPRSNTSRRKVFQDDYIRAFEKADRVVLKHVTARSIDQGVELLDVSTLSDEISRSGVQSACLPDVKAIREHIWKEISFDANAKTPNEVVVVMSNGSFDGLNEMLQRDLEGHSGGAHVALKD